MRLLGTLLPQFYRLRGQPFLFSDDQLSQKRKDGNRSWECPGRPVVNRIKTGVSGGLKEGKQDTHMVAKSIVGLAKIHWLCTRIGRRWSQSEVITGKPNLHILQMRASCTKPWLNDISKSFHSWVAVQFTYQGIPAQIGTFYLYPRRNRFVWRRSLLLNLVLEVGPKVNKLRRSSIWPISFYLDNTLI